MTLLTARETAEQLRISVAGLWRLRKKRKIRIVRIGRRILFDQADLESFVSKSKIPYRVPRI